MPQAYPQGNARLMYLMLLLQAQQQQEQARLAQAQPQPNTLDQIVDYARKAKGAYDDANNLYNLGTSAYNYVSGPVYSPATQAAWNQGAGQASQQLWNAGADAASGVNGTAATPQAPGTNYAGWAAAALSAYNSGKNLLSGNLRDEEASYEAAMAVPRAAGAFYTAGLSMLGESLARKQWGGTMKKLDKFNQTNPMSPVFVPMLASRLWSSDEWKKEGKRLRGLIDKGINIPEELRAAMYLRRGRKTKDLINPYLPKDFVGKTPQYGWTNNKFASSRNEKDLAPEDIWGYSAFFDKYGNDWLGKFSEAQRRSVAQKALERGAVNEHHGTIDIKWNPELEAEVNTILGRNSVAPKAPPQQSPPTVGVTPTPAPVTNRKGFLGRLR